MTVKGLDSIVERAWKCDRKNQDWRYVRPNQVKHLGYIKYLNVWSVKNWLRTGCLLKVANNCIILWNQKLRCSTQFVHRKDKTNNSSVFSLKHSMKRHVFCFEKIELVLVRQRGESSPPPSLPPCGYASVKYT